MFRLRRLNQLLRFLDAKTKIAFVVIFSICVFFLVRFIVSLILLNFVSLLESAVIVFVTVYALVVLLKFSRGVYFVTRMTRKFNYDYYPFSSIIEFPKFAVKNFHAMARKIRSLESINEKLMQIINEIGNVGIVVMDEQKNIVLYNKFVEKFFNLSQSYKGKKFYSLFSLSSHKIDELKEKGDCEMEVMVGNELRVLKICFRDVVGISLIYFFDITELKNFEKITELSLSIFSHELNTPLTNLSLALENLLLSRDISEEIVNALLSNIARISNTVSNIVNLSNIYSNRVLVVPQRFNLRDSVKRLIDTISHSYKSKNLRVELEYSGDEEVVEDRDKLQLILFNLIDNAMKFSLSDSEVRVKICNDGGLRISVSNETEWISEVELERIFERFYRAKNSRGLRGSGLGLYIVKLLCEILGLKVEVSYSDNLIIFTIARESDV
ncbi:MAG: HAMP domain-containing sensor histidine kinase [Brevinematia bacterium]